MYRDDWLMRMVEQVAAIIGRMAGMRQREDYTAALDEADRGWDGLGVRRELALIIDVPSLVGMLRTQEAIQAAIDLLEEEARTESARGDDRAAALRHARAAALRRYRS